jgi:hypothetical protein
LPRRLRVSPLIERPDWRVTGASPAAQAATSVTQSGALAATGGNASGVEAAALRDPGLRMGSNVARAHVTHPVAVEYVAPEEVLGLEPVGSEK